VRLLVALVGVLGAGAALLATVGAVHRRRNELAVLRTLGFRPVQSAAAIAWQAATFGVLGLAVGLPAGVIAGRWGWTTVASDAGVESGPVIPLAALAALIVAVFVVLEALAAVPAAVASRLRPADVLRTE
jgi:putative ABC transport system permease protein